MSELWSMVLLPLLQGSDPAQGAPAGGGSPLGPLMNMLPLFLILYLVVYFMMIRPQKKQQREHALLLGALKKNDQVRTNAGIFGKVVSVDKDREQVVLKIDESNNVRLRVLRSSIVAILNDRQKTESPA
ncbi:MAG: preprotein translocase subunit YajC [Planctomycetota bacterium]